MERSDKNRVGRSVKIFFLSKICVSCKFYVDLKWGGGGGGGGRKKLSVGFFLNKNLLG